MGGHEMHPGGKVGRYIAQDRAFHRTDIGNDCTRRKMRAYFRGHRAARADRNRDNDEIRAVRCCGIGFYDLIRETELGNTPARRSRAGSRDNGVRSALRAGGTRDRGANQTHSDQRKTIEDRGAIHGE
jgi:hypothetical protein